MTEEVLLLDDDPAMLVFLEGVLGSAGYACHAEVDPESALTRVAATPDIGLILSDVCMPGLTGLQFIGRLHALPLRWPTPKVVLLTAHPSLEAAIDALRLGAQDFLLKPIRPPALIDAIDRALERSRADRVADPARPPEMRELVRQAEELAGRLRSLAYANSPYAHTPRRSASRTPHRTSAIETAAKSVQPVTTGALAMEVPQGRELLSVLDTIEQLRRLRDHYREHQLDDLEWELLLELLRAERMHQPMSVSRLTSSTSAASTSTSLRRINHLVSRGYFTRTPDEQDARRDFVALTSKSNLLLADYLARANAHLRDLTG
jgi:CheY-like chemotaxis protein/DNA-binding MarR family transcriptional regulator